MVEIYKEKLNFVSWIKFNCDGRKGDELNPRLIFADEMVWKERTEKIFAKWTKFKRKKQKNQKREG